MNFVEFEINQREQFDTFVKANALDGGLLQLWSWGDFKSPDSFVVKRIGIVDSENNILVAATILKQKFARFFKIFYSPRGPVLNTSLLKDEEKVHEVLKLLFENIHVLSKKENVLMLRVDPAWDIHYIRKNILEDFHFLPCPRDIQPRHTLLVPLQREEELILKNFKSKTRYNLRLAKRKGVTVKMFSNQEVFPEWMKLINKTAKRQNFKMHSESYFKNLFETMIGNDQLFLFVAYYENQAIAMNLVLRSGRFVYYLYGATEDTYRNVMAPYLLHWEIIQHFKEAGCEYYDLWGISNTSSYKGVQDEREKNWEGFSRLKRGFAIDQPITEYLGCWEYPYKETLYKLLGKLR